MSVQCPETQRQRAKHQASQWVQVNKRGVIPSLSEVPDYLGGKDHTTNAQTNSITNCSQFNERSTSVVMKIRDKELAWKR